MDEQQVQLARRMVRKSTLWVFLVFVGLSAFFGTFRSVEAGHVGVVTRLGAVNRVVNPGLAIKVPFFEGIHQMETRTQKETTVADAASKDLQSVDAEVALNYHLDGAKAVDVYQNIGTEYKDRVIAPAIQEEFKAATAHFPASDLIAKRAEVKSEVQKQLKERLAQHNIIVDDFNIVNFQFSKEFDDAIEQKTVAQQNKERAQIEAETALTEAQGQVNAQKALRDGMECSPMQQTEFRLSTFRNLQ